MKPLFYITVLFVFVTCSNPIPEGTVFIKPLELWVDKDEVTIKEFRNFIESKNYRLRTDSVSYSKVFMPSSGIFENAPNVDFRQNTPDLIPDSLTPVTHISWHEACAFCESKKGRLPSAEEWEYVAKRSDYLPGNIWEGFFPFKDEGSDGFICTPAPIRTFRPNDLGIYDLYGNVREWTSSLDSSKKVVVKGGSYLTDYNSGKILPTSSEMLDQSSTIEDLGFRCVYKK